MLNVEATARPIESAREAFIDYYRCPSHTADFATAADLSSAEGYFTFAGNRCFGRSSGAQPAREVTDPLADVTGNAQQADGGLVLPFDLAEVVTNLREERYRRNRDASLTRATSSAVAQGLYYLLRPILTVGVRRHLQQLRLRGWQDIPFPRWPVDSTVDELMRHATAILLRASGAERLPFIWFWPEGAPSCTH